MVDDQSGCPSYAGDVAKMLLRLVETDSYGIYHVTNAGHTSWYGFACRIFELAGSGSRFSRWRQLIMDARP